MRKKIHNTLKRSVNNPTLLKLIIVILLFFVVVLFVQLMNADELAFTQEQKDEMTQEALTYGYEEAIIEILTEVSKCEDPLTLFTDNITRNVVAVECFDSSE